MHNQANVAVPAVTNPSVPTSSTQILAANPQRCKLILCNLGANNIYVNMAGGTASATNGIVLAPNATLIDDTLVSPMAITAIAATGATALHVLEYTK